MSTESLTIHPPGQAVLTFSLSESLSAKDKIYTVTQNTNVSKGSVGKHTAQPGRAQIIMRQVSDTHTHTQKTEHKTEYNRK